MAYFLRFILITIIATGCSCGWHLRGGHAGNTLAQLDLISRDPYSPLIMSVKETMQQRAIAHSDKAVLHLQIGGERLQKRTVAVTNIGSPAQYELSLSVEYHYYFSQQGDKIELPRTVAVQRVFDFDPSSTVAKNEEENTLLNEMRRELAHRILQQASKQIEP